MRIIAGRLGGRQFASPHTVRTHPMGDRVRGALFNTLGDIENLTLLDAFAGTGAIGFEAASRGASEVLLIENDKPAQRSITEAITSLQLAPTVSLVEANCSGWSDNNPSKQYDIVVADPPYDRLQPEVITKLANHVKDGCLYVISWPGKQVLPELSHANLTLTLVEHKTYGDAQLLFYRRAELSLFL